MLGVLRAVARLVARVRMTETFMIEEMGIRANNLDCVDKRDWISEFPMPASQSSSGCAENHGDLYDAWPLEYLP